MSINCTASRLFEVPSPPPNSSLQIILIQKLFFINTTFNPAFNYLTEKHKSYNVFRNDQLIDHRRNCTAWIRPFGERYLVIFIAVNSNYQGIGAACSLYIDLILYAFPPHPISETSEYERLAEEANFLKRIAASMGVTRVHVLSTSIAIQSKSNPLRHEHHQLVQKIRLLQRQNSRAEEELLHILSSRRRR
ncbi:hypothetical protein PGT21_013457 [Puccinia graminis f. sp. tritici]|uniref:Uncharacterized protein n=1 Tax=Puccinia graminis f. sp. tritici TaxID=56615 RepID=A0A5B0QI22_PUCGR|nr:hypothetical protein PGT21_013457 [Puccinia graminis f. sp. tritici]